MALMTIAALFISSSAFAVNDDLGIYVTNDNLSKVKQIIESGEATKDELVEAEPYGPGVPIIALAGRAGSFEVAQYLIGLKANLNAPTPVGETALALASFFASNLSGQNGTLSRHEKVIHALVDAGANLESPGFYSAISYAAYTGNDDIINYLLSKGAKVDSDAQNGQIPTNTGLMFAVRNGFTSTTILFLEHDADPRIVNYKNHDAMYFAELYKQTQLVPYLQCALNLKPGQKYKDYCKNL